MSAYPGFTDGDLVRAAAAMRKQIRFAEAMGRVVTADKAELERIEAEQKRRES